MAGVLVGDDPVDELCRPLDLARLVRDDVVVVLLPGELDRGVPLPDLELLGPDHFDDELHRRARGYLLGQEAADGELTGLLAELYALQDEEEITLETASQLLLRLRERGLQWELASADGERLVELQQTLAKLRDEIRAFA